MLEFNEKIINEFRANNGVVGAPFAGTPLLLLGNTGAKSGEPRTNPLAYFEDADRLIIIASYAGAPKNPPWFYNIVANPQVTVEVGTDKYTATASVIAEPERTQLYARIAAKMPTFAEYANKTTRVIPLIALVRNT